MRRENLHCIDDIKIFEGFGGAYVQPGSYQVKVSIGDFDETVDLTLRPDRRIDTGQDQFDRAETNIIAVTQLLNEMIDALAAARRSRTDLGKMIVDHPDAALLDEAGSRAIERLDEWERQVYQVEYETYEEVGRLPSKLIHQARHLLNAIDAAGPPVGTGALERLTDLQSEWASLRTELAAIAMSDIATVNQWARDNAIPHVSLAPNTLP